MLSACPEFGPEELSVCNLAGFDGEEAKEI